MADDDLTEATTAALNALIGAVHDPKNCLPDEETCWEQNPVHPCFEQDGRHIALYVHPDGVVKLIVEAVAPLLIEQGRRRALDAMHAEFIGDDCAEWTHVDQINDFINKQRTGHRG